VHELSQRYRDGHTRDTTPFLQTSVDVAAYAAFRLPATFAAATAALREVRDLRPDFRPRGVLDAAGGLGTASWAAAEIWPTVEHTEVLERDEHMIRLGQSLAAHAHSPALRAAGWRQIDITAEWSMDSADLVILGYALGELAAESRDTVMRRLWAHTDDTVLVLEPGTPRGSALIRQAGDLLVNEDAAVVAPFPWDWVCIENERDWCHFAARVSRTRLHRSVKGAALSHKDEKYAYVAASRTPGLPIAARVIRHPQIRSGHVRLTLCTAAGVKHVVVTRKNREAFRRARDLAWGSAIEPAEAPLFGLAD